MKKYLRECIVFTTLSMLHADREYIPFQIKRICPNKTRWDIWFLLSNIMYEKVSTQIMFFAFLGIYIIFVFYIFRTGDSRRDEFGSIPPCR